ncbi:MAG: DUF3575 domain-containing protein [Rikenellaceae bacterium]
MRINIRIAALALLCSLISTSGFAANDKLEVTSTAIQNSTDYPIYYSDCEVIEKKEEKQTLKVVKRRPAMAIKTNLLYDLLLTPNLEIDIPMGSTFSFSSELGRGWWRKEMTRCWQILYGSAELRCWLGNRTKRERLTGWFIGAFANCGICDFQFADTYGVQSEFYIAAGVSTGYSLKISKRCLMEFSMGAGYIDNEYQKYWVENNETLIEDGLAMRRQAFMPLKAKISLGWLLYNKKR